MVYVLLNNEKIKAHLYDPDTRQVDTSDYAFTATTVIGSFTSVS
jgi:hypothetical protein